MDVPNDLSRFVKEVALRDGTPVRIRTARPDDRQRLVTAFEGLDRGTVYTRYFSFRKGFSEAELGRLDTPDFDRHILLVVTLLATITELARSRGINRCEADVLAENQAMLSVFRRGGLPMSTSRSGGVVHLVLDLAAPRS